MDDSGLASLGFVIVCIFAVLLFLGVVLLPVLLLIFALAYRPKDESSENTQEDTAVQMYTPEVSVDNFKEAAIERLKAKGVKIRKDVVVNRG